MSNHLHMGCNAILSLGLLYLSYKLYLVQTYCTTNKHILWFATYMTDLLGRSRKSFSTRIQHKAQRHPVLDHDDRSLRSPMKLTTNKASTQTAGDSPLTWYRQGSICYTYIKPQHSPLVDLFPASRSSKTSKMCTKQQHSLASQVYPPQSTSILQCIT